jgi:eukaryotic-like serine/threonine-protein kinase
VIAFEPKAGDVLDDRYRIVGLLGSGGMGSVYRAEHVGIRRPVAIKLLHPSHADDPEFSRRFEREAFVTGRTSHPNCVTVSDFGKLDDGGYYLVMELVDGVLLADLLDEAVRLPEQRALHIARHVLRGLGHAHRAGIVHRDIKPANVILVDQDGDPDFAKLLDFGIAKVVDETIDTPDQKLTRVGTTVGTPTYIAPEQAVGGAVDGRSDLYSLSVMLYEMLTGQPPYRDDDVVRLLAKHMTEPMPAMAAMAPDAVISPEAEALVRKGLAKDRAERWQSAAEYVAAIDLVLAAAGVPITPTPLPGSLSAVSVATPGTPTPWPASSPAVAASAARPTPTGLARVAAPRTTRRRLVTAAAVAAALGAILVIASRGGDSSRAAGHGAVSPSGQLTLPRQPKVAAERLAAAREALRKGRTDEALGGFARALELDPLLTDDLQLRVDLAALSEHKAAGTALRALELRAMALDDDTARAALITMAGTDKRNAWRMGARAITEPAGWLSSDELLGSYLLDLGLLETCEKRRTAIPPLLALDDRRAVPWLEKARRRTSGGFLGIGEKTTNGCMKKELDEAIAALSGG